MQMYLDHLLGKPSGIDFTKKSQTDRTGEAVKRSVVLKFRTN